MATPEEQLAQARAQLRETIADGLITLGRSQGFVETVEGLRVLLADRDVELPQGLAVAAAGLAEENERRERHLRDALDNVETADPATIVRLHTEAIERTKAMHDRLAVAQEWSTGE